MPKPLKAFQSEFKTTMLEGGAPFRTNHPHFSAEALTEVYSNNVMAGTTRALSLTFPVIEKLVGERFFTAMAGQFIQTSPPTSGNLDDYGEAFPAFIAAFKPAESLPYLTDVAQLEWAWQLASRADKTAHLSPQELALPPEQLATLKLSLHPSAHLLTSPYPIDRIWATNQENTEEETISLEEGPVWLLIVRHHRKVEIASLTQAKHCFLSELAAGKPLGEAFDHAIELDEQFTLEECLPKHLSFATFQSPSK